MYSTVYVADNNRAGRIHAMIHWKKRSKQDQLPGTVEQNFGLYSSMEQSLGTATWNSGMKQWLGRKRPGTAARISSLEHRPGTLARNSSLNTAGNKRLEHRPEISAQWTGKRPVRGLEWRHVTATCNSGLGTNGLEQRP
jgi:hypothetical protein